MVTEIARLTAARGRGEEFREVFQAASRAHYAQAGCRSDRLLRSTQDDAVFVAVVEWVDRASLDAAVASDVGQAFLARIGPLLAGAPQLDLYEVADGA